MKLSKRRILACFLAVMLCMAAFSIPAYAEGGDYQEYEIPPEENINPEVLTPEGNMTLVDDITGEAANEKEFITVVTKNGHYFYIVIDRSDSGNNTVHFLKQVERGDLSAEDFEADIRTMIAELIGGYVPVEGSAVLFQDSRAIIGKCPRCGYPVIERDKGFFCQNRSCSFALWKSNRFFESKHKELDSEVASALLNDGSVLLTDCFSERTGKNYNATVILEDDGERPSFRMVF